jgi:hypothetical protein
MSCGVEQDLAGHASPRCTSSCMRFRQRRKVDLPQPDGPMMAVIWRLVTVRSMPFTTSLPENAARRPVTVIFMCGEPGSGCAARSRSH